MKTLKMFEPFEVKQFLKGRVVDISDGVGVCISPEALTDMTGNETVPRTKKDKQERKRYGDKRREKGTTFYLKHFVQVQNKSSCKVCGMAFEGKMHRLAAMTHLRRSHPKQWRKKP